MITNKDKIYKHGSVLTKAMHIYNDDESYFYADQILLKTQSVLVWIKRNTVRKSSIEKIQSSQIF